jgi:hypothetical protein
MVDVRKSDTANLDPVAVYEHGHLGLIGYGFG